MQTERALMPMVASRHTMEQRAAPAGGCRRTRSPTLVPTNTAYKKPNLTDPGRTAEFVLAQAYPRHLFAPLRVGRTHVHNLDGKPSLHLDPLQLECVPVNNATNSQQLLCPLSGPILPCRRPLRVNALAQAKQLYHECFQSGSLSLYHAE